jgi:hypothetical protein
MDPFSTLQKEIERLKYIESQKENYTDLTSYGENSIFEFSKILFSKNPKNLDVNLSEILFDEDAEYLDIFCTILEIILYGVDILTESKNSIFDLKSCNETLVNEIKKYMKSIGYNVIITEENNTTDYYCEIVPKKNNQGWCILNYQIKINSNFKYPYAFFVSNEKIFCIRIERILHY